MARHELLDALVNAEESPLPLLGDCLVRIDEVAPDLLAVVENAADGTLVRPDDENLLFLALHILGAGRVERLHAPLMRLLRRPIDELDELLGDAKTETLGKIIAGGFNGNANDLFELLYEPSIDEFMRDSVFGAVAFLTWAGRIDAAVTRDFLLRFDVDRPIPAGDFAWFSWASAIELLGWSDLAEHAETAYRDGRIDDSIGTINHFRDGLAVAQRAAPGNDRRFQEIGQGYIKDIVDTLRNFMFRSSNDNTVEYDPAPSVMTEPVQNPFRHVGRNDPCPCGSGKKYKRCCLAA